MKIFIDIGHPAHVHYFRNFIKLMGQKGHQFFVSARNKEIAHQLLNYYKIPYYNRGKGRNSAFGKLISMLFTDLKLLIKARKFKPDLFLSFAIPFTAHVAWLMRKPHIVLDDTEHAKLGHAFYKPFSTVFLNPVNFNRDFGEKQIKFNSYIELAYLHKNYFNISKELTEKNEGKKRVFIRFVSWNANHDIGYNGMDYHAKIKLVETLKKHAEVHISSEGELPETLKSHRYKKPPWKVHEFMASCDLFIGEGATMASECAMMGVPAIYVNKIECNTLNEQEDKYQLVYNFRNDKGVLEKALELLNLPDFKLAFQQRRQNMLKEKIDITSFLSWFIENYPKSFDIIKSNPDFQYKFC